MSTQKKDKRKLSLGASQTVPAMHMAQQQMPQMWPAMQMFDPCAMMPMGNPASMSLGCASSSSKETNKKPWDTSDSESEDSDFTVQTKKKRKVNKSTSTPVGGEKKRGPGRPKKEDTALKQADIKIVQEYPLVSGKDKIAFLTPEECKSCRLWKGRVAVQPCGHAHFCFTCMEKFKENAVKLQRPGKCLADNCFEIVTSWFTLFNVSP